MTYNSGSGLLVLGRGLVVGLLEMIGLLKWGWGQLVDLHVLERERLVVSVLHSVF